MTVSSFMVRDMYTINLIIRHELQRFINLCKLMFLIAKMINIATTTK